MGLNLIFGGLLFILGKVLYGFSAGFDAVYIDYLVRLTYDLGSFILLFFIIHGCNK